jgi:hypothetical protein
LWNTKNVILGDKLFGDVGKVDAAIIQNEDEVDEHAGLSLLERLPHPAVP